MARTAAVDPAAKAFLEEVGAEITKIEDSFVCESPYMATVKYADGTFKKKTLMAGWEFFLSYAYVGQRGQIIFGFTPEDAQEYSYVEMDLKEIDKIFPLFGSVVAEKFGVDGEKAFDVFANVLFAKEIEKKKEAVASLEKYENDDAFGMF